MNVEGTVAGTVADRLSGGVSPDIGHGSLIAEVDGLSDNHCSRIGIAPLALSKCQFRRRVRV
jgi:hypothetical protein